MVAKTTLAAGTNVKNGGALVTGYVGTQDYWTGR